MYGKLLPPPPTSPGLRYILSSVAKDVKYGKGLKLEKNDHFFQVMELRLHKIANNLSKFALAARIRLISSSYSFVGDCCVRVKVLCNYFSTVLILKQ